MKDQSKPLVYRTEKLTFAAYLIAADKAELVGTEPTGSSRNVLFLLSNSPGACDVTEFFNGRATVKALRYSESINTLKSAAYEARRCQC